MVGNGKDKPHKERTNFRGTFTSVKPCFHSGNHIHDGKLNKEFPQSQTLYSSFFSLREETNVNKGYPFPYYISRKVLSILLGN